MPITLREYLEQAPKRDEEERAAHVADEEAEDAYYNAISALIDAHPIGRPMHRFG